MSINFFTTNGDDGSTQSSSVQPVANAEAVNAAVTNRPSENLRNRTELLRKEVNGLDLSLTQYVISVDNGAGALGAIHWDGVFLPAGGAVPAENTVNSGRVWLTTTAGTSPSVGAQILIRPAGSPPSDVKAYRKISMKDAVSATYHLTFTSKRKAAYGANYFRVRLYTTAAYNSGVVVTLTHPHVNVVDPTTSPVISPKIVSSVTASQTAPAVPTGNYSTINILVNDPSTTPSTVTDVINAIAGNATANAMISVSCDVSNSSAVNITAQYPSKDTGYISLDYGIDAVAWTVTDAVLASFFDSGVVNTTLVDTVPGAGTFTVRVSSVTNISVGTVLNIGSTGTSDYEQVTVTAVDGVGVTITAVFTLAHSAGHVVTYGSNLVQAGDTICVNLGDAYNRIYNDSYPKPLTASYIVNTRVAGSAQAQYDNLLPLFTVTSSSTSGIFAGKQAISVGSTVESNGNRATVNSYGIVKVQVGSSVGSPVLTTDQMEVANGLATLDNIGHLNTSNTHGNFTVNGTLTGTSTANFTSAVTTSAVLFSTPITRYPHVFPTILGTGVGIKFAGAPDTEPWAYLDLTSTSNYGIIPCPVVPVGASLTQMRMYGYYDAAGGAGSRLSISAGYRTTNTTTIFATWVVDYIGAGTITLDTAPGAIFSLNSSSGTVTQGPEHGLLSFAPAAPVVFGSLPSFTVSTPTTPIFIVKCTVAGAPNSYLRVYTIGMEYTSPVAAAL